MPESQDSSMPEQKKASLVAIASGVIAGAGAGIGTAHHTVRRFLYDRLEEKGWFDKVRKKAQSELGKAVDHEMASYSYGTEEMACGESIAVKAEYRKACDRIISERGIEGLSESFNALEQNQKTKVIAFTAAAAIGVGTILYKGLDYIMQRRVVHDEHTPSR
jgi:hypothetical protein